MEKSKKLMLTINILLIATVFVLNYFYQKNGFVFSLKCICSGIFALLGLINLSYAKSTKQPNTNFFTGMASALILAMLGDIFINFNFIVGAAVFALGHICFIIAYCFLHRLKPHDCIIGGVLFLGGASFLLFAPFLVFDNPIFKVVCVAYALIISVMLGKAVGNFLEARNALTGTQAFASALFFFSDLMLVLDKFGGLWSRADNACMGTYYPALCLLALSMFICCALSKDETSKIKENGEFIK